MTLLETPLADKLSPFPDSLQRSFLSASLLRPSSWPWRHRKPTVRNACGNVRWMRNTVRSVRKCSARSMRIPPALSAPVPHASADAESSCRIYGSRMHSACVYGLPCPSAYSPHTSARLLAIPCVRWPQDQCGRPDLKCGFRTPAEPVVL